ncbi:ATP synthase F1 subunit epsilon [Clostridium frigoris]|uniref:ATP synthase epsilon chain n=1 Tax=Clostridium frigoris TaxID=205327 RepID=A0ABS6BSI5_9CLOT|nr:ATP synthase F1 subunit epsilon [Clostridium frigoris]MBU3159329.1 ATP synthase F1 subunit epsilon [Clostridium frigoris]
MKNHIKLTMITPEKEFYSGDVVVLNSQSDEGVFGILANHIPMISQLKPTVTTFTQVDGKELKAFTSTGVLRVLKGQVEMLCSACEWPEDIDAQRANEAKKRAEKRLNDDSQEINLKRAEGAVLRSIMRLKTKN